jgi:hypothetical protein
MDKVSGGDSICVLVPGAFSNLQYLKFYSVEQQIDIEQ